MLVFLTIAVMLIVAYAHSREGVLTAVAMLVNLFLAGLVAFNFFEPLAAELESALAGSFLAGYEDALCLFGLFALTLGVLRAITNHLANTELALPALVQQVGASAVGLVTGYLAAGFLACVLQTLPWSEKFLGFDSSVDTQQGSGMRRVLPADRVWLAMMHRAGGGFGALVQAPANPFDPHGTFELRYSKLRRLKEQEQ